MNPVPTLDHAHLRRGARGTLLVGVVAFVVLLVGALFDPGQFFRAYLVSYLFYWGLALGAMVLLMIYHLTGGAWGFLIRRVLEAQMLSLPLLALLFIPVGFGIRYLYGWAATELIADFPPLHHLQSYLNLPFFLARAAAYFIAWCTMAWLLGRWSRQQDESDDPRLATRSATLSGAGLVLYGLILHFAAVDWIMSIQPLFRTTIIGPHTAGGQLVSALAVTLVLFCWLARPVIHSRVYSLSALNDLGSLMLTMLILWCYFVWFRFMLIWVANLPPEVLWYAPRSQGVWLGLGISLLFLHVLIPFFMLLFRAAKQRPTLLASVAGMIAFMHLIYMNFQVLPAYETHTLAENWMTFLMPIAFGGIWLAYVLRLLMRHPLLVMHDQNLHRALRLREFDEEAAQREEMLLHES